MVVLLKVYKFCVHIAVNVCQLNTECFIRVLCVETILTVNVLWNYSLIGPPDDLFH